MDRLTIDDFFERLRDMPDVEAVQEIDLRIQRIEQSRRALTPRRSEEEVVAHLATLNQDETRLRTERHLIVMRMDKRKWSKAVRALWGEEGLEQCLIWMETMGEPDTKQVALTPKGRA